ncbi:MAG TPA: class I SAM-dependent RNA methyltransferase [Stellaceae bacterium]|nr:class I SAM-dependent RNA methyltransferase [Stellaceae bacterium]
MLVERMGTQGDGIATWQGGPVYVPFAMPGDRVRAEIGVRRSSGREGRVIDWLASGPGRAEPSCRHFGICGGCALQHLAVEAYRAVKLGGLQTALTRVGIDPAIVGPLRMVPPARRRARLGLLRPKGPDLSAIVGFRERFRHALVDLRDCAVLEPALFALVEPLRRSAQQWLTPGGSAEVTLTRIDTGIDLLIEASQPPPLAALEALSALAEAHDLVRIVWRTGRDDTPVIERRPARVVFSGVPVPFPPGAFLQASREAEAALVTEVVAALGDRRPVLDLYAGLGTFTFAMAAEGAVYAVEGDAAAVAALAQAASQLRGVTVERRDLDRNPLPAEALTGYAAALFDPPRAGALRQTAELAASTLKTVVAVSCNPATFARDAARLIAGGFRLEKILPVDQFVWTPHLELVATFRR